MSFIAKITSHHILLLFQFQATLRAMLLPAVLEQYAQQQHNDQAPGPEQDATHQQIVSACKALGVAGESPSPSASLATATGALMRPLYPHMFAHQKQHELSLDLDSPGKTMNGEAIDEVVERAEWFYDEFSVPAPETVSRLDEEGREEALQATLDAFAE